MTLATHLSPTRLEPVEVIGEEDNRVHRRFEVMLAGRFMRADKSEHACQVRDVSVGGMALLFAEPGKRQLPLPTGEKIVAYVDQLGGLHGEIVRSWPGGFALKIVATQHKREKLAAQITWLLNEADLAGVAARKHERVVVRNRANELKLAGGIAIPCLILDVSVSGASVACKAWPEIDTEVYLGGFRARVVRHHTAGLGLQFMELTDLETLTVTFG